MANQEASEKELDKPIDEATFADLWGLFEHGRPTKRELDRVIKGLGYVNPSDYDLIIRKLKDPHAVESLRKLGYRRVPELRVLEKG